MASGVIEPLDHLAGSSGAVLLEASGGDGVATQINDNRAGRLQIIDALTAHVGTRWFQIATLRFSSQKAVDACCAGTGNK
jgi:hypothetical protein